MRIIDSLSELFIRQRHDTLIPDLTILGKMIGVKMAESVGIHLMVSPARCDTRMIAHNRTFVQLHPRE
jgi:hypothetical protein